MFCIHTTIEIIHGIITLCFLLISAPQETTIAEMIKLIENVNKS